MRMLLVELAESSIPNHTCFAVSGTPDRLMRPIHYRFIPNDAYKLLLDQGKSLKEIALLYSVSLRDAV